MIRKLSIACCLVATLSIAATKPAATQPAGPSKDGMGREYWLYSPSKTAASRDYRLVVGVHGYGGNGAGAAGLAEWSTKRDCFVLGPSFPNDGYQLLLQEADTQLVNLLKDLRGKLRLKPRVFLFGFSGGAQFVHRFTQRYPDLVAGCAAHSAGTWATGGEWGELNPEAKPIPLVISCGQRDTAKSVPQAPFARIEWAHQFEQQLRSGGFAHAATYPRDAGHSYGPEAAALTEICFKAATGKAETLAAQRAEVAALLAKGNTAAAQALAARSKVRVAPVAADAKPETALDASLGLAHNAALDALLSEGKGKISK